MRPVEEQTVLITGGTDGLGRATARELARRGATVLVHGRSEDKLADAVRSSGAAAGYLADLADYEQVRGLAAEVRRDRPRLDGLINNAGVGGIPRATNERGHELHLAVNHLAPFLLTRELLALLRASAPARVVNVSSVGQAPVEFDDLMLDRRYDPFGAYARSKLAQILFTFELAERLAADGEEGVTVTALHPATLMDTRMVRRAFGRPRSSVEEGVRAVVRLAVDPELEGVTGAYFDGEQPAEPHPQARDPDARRRLWEVSEALTRPA